MSITHMSLVYCPTYARMHTHTKTTPQAHHTKNEYDTSRVRDKEKKEGGGRGKPPPTHKKWVL